jgi:hypothetical protein
MSQLFPFDSNDFQSVPATPRDMLATWGPLPVLPPRVQRQSHGRIQPPGIILTTNTSRRAILAGAANLPALSMPAIAADPVFAAIENHRQAYEKWIAALEEVEKLNRPYAERQPRIPLYPERELISSSENDGETMIHKARCGGTTGKYHYATNAQEIERASREIPKEDRDAWIADRRRALAQEKSRIRWLMMESGESERVRQEVSAGNMEYELSQQLLATQPTTLAGCKALIDYVLKYNSGEGGYWGNELMPDGSDPVMLLQTLSAAIVAA